MCQGQLFAACVSLWEAWGFAHWFPHLQDICAILTYGPWHTHLPVNPGPTLAPQVEGRHSFTARPPTCIHRGIEFKERHLRDEALIAHPFTSQ